jgi:hypothetical protein
MTLMDGRPLPSGMPDHHIVDLYDVRCPERSREVFVDMYHCAPGRNALLPQ